jgi:hypothetical protein
LNHSISGRERTKNATPHGVPPKVEDGGNVRIAQELDGHTDGLAGCHLLLDFTNVEALGSEELGTLIRLHKKLAADGGRLTLFNLTALVYEVLTISRLHTLLGICRERPVPTSPSPGRESVAASTFLACKARVPATPVGGAGDVAAQLAEAMMIRVECLSWTAGLRDLLRAGGWRLEGPAGDAFYASHPEVGDQPAARSRLHCLGLLTSPRLRIEFGPFRGAT